MASFDAFRALFPKITLTDDVFGKYYNISKSFISSDYEQFEYFRFLMIAHLQEVNSRSGDGAGGVVKEKEDEIEVEYQTIENFSLSQSKYGIQLSQLLDLVNAPDLPEICC